MKTLLTGMVLTGAAVSASYLAYGDAAATYNDHYVFFAKGGACADQKCGGLNGSGSITCTNDQATGLLCTNSGSSCNTVVCS
jgi:hypothetical protein